MSLPNGVVIKWFPDEFIELNREVEHHPLLMELLKSFPADEWELRLGCIASYCEILLDAEYNEEDLRGIAKACFNKLNAKRGKVMLLDGKFS